MKKRLISLLLVFSMLLTLLPTSVFATGSQGQQVLTSVSASVSSNPFTDVKESDWFYDAVQYAQANGFFSGTSETTFAPGMTMTRGMFVTVLAKMAGVDGKNYAGKSTFTDVPRDAYYEPYVAWASEHGVTSGIGGGKFAPDVLINREQMATFFVGYFEKFGVDYDTGANITTIPGDLDQVSSWAQDSVLKLWKQGLLVGDGKSFNPSGSASRAEAAALCRSADKAVDTWYSEPGVPSGRISVDPATGEGMKPVTPEQPSGGDSSGSSSGGSSSGGSSGGSSSGGTTITDYYQVNFALGSGQNIADVKLPDNKLYAKGTKVSEFSTPYKANYIFVGWYADKAMTQPISSDTELSGNINLYAKMTEATATPLQEVPNYITVMVPANKVSSYVFEIVGSASDIEHFKHITNMNAEVDYSVNGSKVNAGYAPGQTYSFKLKDNTDTLLKVGGEVQPVSTRVLNIITEKEEVQNLRLDNDVKYLPAAQISDMTGIALDGLFSVSISGQTGEATVTQNKNEGTFTYSGSGINVGDVVAIYEGTNPKVRNTASQNEAVAYVEITKIDGDKYTYRTADSKDILFTPDILPIPMDADQVKDDVNKLTLSASALDFSSAEYGKMGLSASTKVEKDDFVALYEGELNTGAEVSYGLITKVTEDGDKVVIEYEPSTMAEVMASMDIYNTRNEDIEMSDEEIKKLEDELEQQALESGFLDEAAEYLTALAVETNGFTELSEDLDLDLSSYNITFEDGTPVDPDSMELMASLSAEITEKEVKPNIIIGNLVHFQDGEVPLQGIRAEVVMTFKVEFKLNGETKMEIEMQAVFEEEILLSINVTGGAIWEWWGPIPYLDDYNMNANLDVGTYTGIGITATLKTVGEEDEEDGDGDKEDGDKEDGDKEDDKTDDNKRSLIGEDYKVEWDDYDWKEIADIGDKTVTAGDRIVHIGDEIKDLMNTEQEFFRIPTKGLNGDESAGNVEFKSLEERYSEMMEEAEDSWITIFEKEIFQSEGFVDPLHILCYGIKADFVVSANLYVTMGMTFEYGVAKRYNFSLMLFSHEVTSETIDLETEHYQFDFYVMGTVGIRAGVEFELVMALFSMDVDSVGIEAEVGVYAQLWGYFYYHLGWEKGQEKTSTCSGALAIEIGAYLNIAFKAQLFNCEKLTYNPTLYENEWPFLTIGSIENISDFSYPEDDEELLHVEMKSVLHTVLPTELYNMNYMDMKSGDLYGFYPDDEEHDPKENPPVNYDTEAEERFIIELSNPNFSYDPKTNELTVDIDPEKDTYEYCEMTITWAGAPLAFSSESLSRTVVIEWTNPAGIRHITFNSWGGSYVKPIAVGWGEEIPETAYTGDPTRVGYKFLGWTTGGFLADGSGTLFEVPEIMPDYPEHERYGHGVMVYANWEPLPVKYTVNHRIVDENFYLVDMITKEYTALADSDVLIDSLMLDAYAEHYQLEAHDKYLTVKPDGTTVLDLRYKPKTFTITFEYGTDIMADGGYAVEPLELTGKYNTYVPVPELSKEGWEFKGYGTKLAQAETKTETVGDKTYTYVKVKGDATYTGQWGPRQGITYRVEHHVLKPSGFGYELAENGVEYKLGDTGDRIWIDQISRKENGLQVDKVDVALYGIPVYEDKDFKVAADGSTVVKLFYGRGSYELTYFQDGINKATRTVRYGATLPFVLEIENTNIPGKTFLGWFFKTGEGENDWQQVELGVTTMPAQNMSVYARYELTNYNIEYRLDGGALPEGQTNPATYNIESGEITLVSPVREGYTFAGWGGDINADGKIVPGDLLKDLVCLANWTRNEYTINFDMGGAPAKEPAKFMFGTAVTVADPTWEGHTFMGWSPALPETMPAQDLTVTAQWDEAKYTIAWDLNGGTASNEYTTDGEYSYGTAIIAPEVTRPGYNFGGWGAEVPETISKNLSFKAKWNPKAYTITYTNAGIAELPENAPYSYTIEKVGLKLMNPVREGYTFLGWTGANGDVPQLDVTVDVTKLENLTYIGNWEANQYTITFNSNGGTEVAPITQAYETQITAPADPTREGFTFKGWEPALPAIMPAEDLTVIAQWEARDYSITWNLGGGTAANSYTTSGKIGDTITAPVFAARPGFTFAGWDQTPETITGDMTFTAQWRTWSMGIDFMVNLPDGVDNVLQGSMLPQQVTAGEENKIVNKYSVSEGVGYAPDSWNTKADGTGKSYPLEFSFPVEDILDHPDEMFKLYLQWKAIPAQYKMALYLQDVDGKYAATPDQLVTDEKGDAGTTVNVTAADFSGFDFTHYELDASKPAPTGVITADGRLVINAYFARKTYEIKWLDDDNTVLKTESVRYGVTPDFGKDPVKESSGAYSFTFIGWTPEVAMVTGPATYQATYSTTDAKYTVKWDTNGGIFYWDNPASTKGEVAYGTVITAPDENEVKREGGEGNDKPVYTFLGWSTEREGGEIITDFGTVTKDVTYYAQWKVETKKFMVTWYYGGEGSILQKEQMVAYGEMPVYTGNTPTKAEDQNYFYDFVGWDKEVVPVTGQTSYTATFTAVPAVYVTWQNWDSTILETDKVRQGAAVPTYNGAEPSRAEDAQFTYTFSGWAPDADNYSAVNENITFVAQFDTTLRSYTVTWKNWDGSVLETDTVEYGTTPVYNSDPPTKAETEEYRYDFAGWDATPVAVTGDVTYTATFDPIWQGGSIYNVWVGGVQVTEGNKSDILGDQDGAAITASYDDTTKTLMLNNFKYEDAGIGYDNGNAVIRTSYDELNIVLEGENVIRNTASGGYGILMGTNWANISGPGKLVVYGNNAAIRASVYIREYADVIISGETRAVDGTLTVTRTERTVNGYTSTTPDSTPAVLGQPYVANVSSYKCIESFETYTITWNSEPSTETATLRYGTPIKAPEASAVKVVNSTFGWDKVVEQIGWNTSNGASTALKEFGVVSGNVTYYPVWSEPVYHYNMYIGDIRVTSKNADNILGNGTASYNAETKTLTLNKFNYVGEVTNANGYYDNIFAVLYLQTAAADGDLTINLIGENVITNTTTVTNDGQLAAGIYAYASNASLIFTGTGTLTVTGGNGSTDVKTNSAGIVTATANTYGATASTGLKVMDDCTITAIGGSAYNSYGMKAGIFKMYAGELDLVGGTCKNNEGESLGMSFSGIEELAKQDDCQKYQLIARSENGMASNNKLSTTFNVDLYGDATPITPEQETYWIELWEYKHVKLTWKQSS